MKLQFLKPKIQLRSTLGLFNYFRKHIHAFADKAKPLTDLTAKRVPQNIKKVWTQNHTKALDNLKDSLIEACNSSLSIVQFDKPFEIYVDASATAAAGHMVQTDRNGVENPVAFFSTKFTLTQRNWATIERETYAILTALRKYREWAFGNKIVIHCDHNPLTYLTASAPKSSKLMRWSFWQSLTLTFGINQANGTLQLMLFHIRCITCKVFIVTSLVFLDASHNMS